MGIPGEVKDFLEGLVGRSDNTVDSYKSFSNVFWDAWDPKKPLKEITVQDFMKFLKWGLDVQKWKLSTMGQYAKIGQRLFGELKDEDFMKELKKQMRMLPKSSKYESLYEGVYIPPDRINEFIEAAPDEEYAVVYTMILKWGCRLSEALEMDKQDIDPKILRVTVRGKGRGREHKIRIVWVDAQSIRRVLAFAGCTSEEMNGTIQIRTKGRIVHTSPRAVEYVWKKTAEKLGLKHADRLTPHDGRHSFAIDFMIKRKKEGMAALVMLKNQLGHSNINTTMIYLDIAGTEARDILEAGYE